MSSLELQFFTNGNSRAGPACGWSQRSLDWQSSSNPGIFGKIYSWEFSHDDSLADLGGYITFMFFGFNSPRISACSHKIQCPSRVTEVVGCAEGYESSPELTSISLRSFSQAQPQLRRFLWREAGAACVSLGGDCWVSAALMVSAVARRCPTPEIPASTSGICSVFLPPP